MDTYEPLVCDIVKSYSVPFVSKFWTTKTGCVDITNVAGVTSNLDTRTIRINYTTDTPKDLTFTRSTAEEFFALIASLTEHIKKREEYLMRTAS
jgi:hypothetical protein